ncbi:MAG: ATP synthase F1 subunit delta [Acidimicrobiales bacterium]|nr:ATP synthase F1 subunit delta [Acidimicrobiales bacterium]
MSNRINAYADAAMNVAAAEGATADVERELNALANAVAGNAELGSTLANEAIPAAQRQQIVEDLLGGNANQATTAIVSMIVGAGRAGDLAEIAGAVAERGAQSRGANLAEVRSAVPLSDDQISRLSAALRQQTGRDVEVSVVIDPSVVGGLVTQIGDTVIDGSVKRRLTQMRESLAG